jgi:hypothetical protein
MPPLHVLPKAGDHQLQISPLAQVIGAGGERAEGVRRRLCAQAAGLAHRRGHNVVQSVYSGMRTEEGVLFACQKPPRMTCR